MKEEYLINESTLAILPFGHNQSRVVESNKNLTVNLKPIEIINNSCLYYGSSLTGRCDSSGYFLGSRYKVPILINESSNIIMFPTESYRNKTCIWVNYNGVSKFKVLETNKLSTLIELINHKLITVNISNRVISNQFLKSSRLDSIYKSKNR